MNFKQLIFCCISFMLLFSCKNNYYEQKRLENARSKKVKSQLEIANRGLVRFDSTRIVGVARANNWDIQATSTGLWYEFLEKGTGPVAEVGMRAGITYKVRLIDGRLIYSSDSTGVKHFTISQGGVERGLEEGILLMKQGDSVRFIMPPYMAHHLMGDQNKIPRRATIIYEVRLKTLEK